MTARISPPKRATHATPGPVSFNSKLFDERAEALGAELEVEKAALVGVDTSTLWRFRRGEYGPRLEVARRFAAKLSDETVTVAIEDLWPES